MIKQSLALILVSIAIVLAMPYAQQYVQQGSQLILNAHEWISQLLTEVFSGGQVGNLLRGLIALLCLPLLAAMVSATMYWLAKKHWFPYFMHVVWIIWFLQAGALLMVQNGAF